MNLCTGRQFQSIGFLSNNSSRVLQHYHFYLYMTLRPLTNFGVRSYRWATARMCSPNLSVQLCRLEQLMGIRFFFLQSIVIFNRNSIQESSQKANVELCAELVWTNFTLNPRTEFSPASIESDTYAMRKVKFRVKHLKIPQEPGTRNFCFGWNSSSFHCFNAGANAQNYVQHYFFSTSTIFFPTMSNSSSQDLQQIVL